MDEIDLVVTKLTNAQKNGEYIDIVYLGGSQPNTIRTIFPIEIGYSDVLADCIDTDKKKRFTLEKIKIDTAGQTKYDCTLSSPDTLEEFLSEHQDTIHKALNNLDIEVSDRSNEVKGFIRTTNAKLKPKRGKVDVFRIYADLDDPDIIYVWTRFPMQNRPTPLQQLESIVTSAINSIKLPDM